VDAEPAAAWLGYPEYEASDQANVPVVWLEVAALEASDSPRLDGEDPEHVRRLAESQDPLPPILVQRRGLRVIDGMHRLLAARLRGAEKIEARLVDCDSVAGFVLAVRANVTHGLPLPLTDRKAAALRILSDFPGWSNQRVGTAVGLAGKTVAALRECPSGSKSGLDIRVGRDGRSRPVDPSAKRALVRRLIDENPDLSLRSIAREAGVSPETVRKVKSAGRARISSQAQRSGPVAAPTTRPRPLKDPAAFRPGGNPGPDRVRSVSSGEVTAQEINVRGLLNSLMADPAVRSSDAGRTLIRAIAFSALICESGERLAKAVPDHSIRNVMLAAQACSDGWSTVVLNLQRRS
jgi:ParB-like chromosome segregation protein Spo0J